MPSSCARRDLFFWPRAPAIDGAWMRCCGKGRRVSEQAGHPESAIAALVSEFLTALAHERGASPHTLRAYQRELHDFAAYLTDKLGAEFPIHRVEHRQIRAYLSELYGRGLS